MITISEIAELAGVTVKAVRLYHARGLLPEPPREANGYRSYGPDHVLALVRIRRLRELGLPLRRIGELLDGPETGWRDALRRLDAELAAEQLELARRRAVLAEVLAMPGDLALPPRLAAVLDQARAAGYPERTLQQERDAILLALALNPHAADGLVEVYDLMGGLDGAAVAELAGDYEALAEVADPDDPRVVEVAARLVACFESVVRSAAEQSAEASQAAGGTAAHHPRLDERTVERLLGQFWSDRSSPAQLQVQELASRALQPAPDPR